MWSRKTRRKIRPTRCFVAYTVLLFSGRFLWACGIYFQYIHSEARNMWAEERKEIFNDARKFSEENIFMYKDIQFCWMYRYYVPMSPYCRMNLLRCKEIVRLCWNAMLHVSPKKQQQRWPKKRKKEFITHLQHRQRKYLEYLINIRRQAVEFHTRENEQFIVQLEIIAACPLHEAYVSEERKPLVFSYQNHEVIQLIYSLDMDSWRKQSRERGGGENEVERWELDNHIKYLHQQNMSGVISSS